MINFPIDLLEQNHINKRMFKRKPQVRKLRAPYARLLWSVIGISILFFLCIVWVLYDLKGGPVTVGFAGWLYDYQILIGGISAIGAAGVAVLGQMVLYHREQIDRQRYRSQTINKLLINLSSIIAGNLSGLLLNIKNNSSKESLSVNIGALKDLLNSMRKMMEAWQVHATGPDDSLNDAIIYKFGKCEMELMQATNILKTAECYIDGVPVASSFLDDISKCSENFRKIPFSSLSDDIKLSDNS